MLNNEIEKLKSLLNKVLNDLFLIETKEFQINFDNAKARMIAVHKLKNELIVRFPMEELKKYESELTSITKQIHKKYDNIIALKKKKMRLIEERQRFLSNKKKLIYYSR